MSGGNVPPRIYMNLHAGTSDADANSTPMWVWYGLFGAITLAVFGLGLWVLLNTAI